MRGRRNQVGRKPHHHLFQSTPPCGGDKSPHMPYVFGRYFNPRPHAGATFLQRVWAAQTTHFNPRPHAGATERYIRISRRLTDFNPRPHAGATSASDAATQANTAFQSTPPCGGDPERLDFRGGDRDFNPRPHAGATDFLLQVFHLLPKISIHAPMRGRLVSLLLLTMSMWISIHAPMRGRRVCPPCRADR